MYKSPLSFRTTGSVVGGRGENEYDAYLRKQSEKSQKQMMRNASETESRDRMAAQAGTQALTPEQENLKRNNLLRSGGLTYFQGGPKTTEEAFSAFQKAKPTEKGEAWSSVEGMMQGEQDEEKRQKMYNEFMKKKSLTQTPTRKEPSMSELGMLRESMGRIIG